MGILKLFRFDRRVVIISNSGTQPFRWAESSHIQT